MHPADLEHLVSRELGRLPEPPAPHTLLPRVMAAVREWSQRPWYERAWFTWPFGWQLVSVACLLVLLTGSVMLMPRAEAAAGGVASRLTSGVRTDVETLTRRGEVAITAARIVWRTAVEPYVAYAFVFVALLCGMCAAFATALNHVVAPGRT